MDQATFAYIKHAFLFELNAFLQTFHFTKIFK